MKTLMQIIVILALLPMAVCTAATCGTCGAAVLAPDTSQTNDLGGDWGRKLKP